MSPRARVLVIDDDPLFRSLIASLLRREFDVAVAADGAEGFYKALESPPDAAIVDVQMPGWDGVKTLKAFRKHPALSRVRTMILSADATKDTVLTAIHAGADDYLIKTSFSKEGFFEKLARLLPGLVSVPSVVTESAPAPEPRTIPDAPHAVPCPAMTACLPPAPEPVPAGPTMAMTALDESRLQEILDEWD